MELKRVVVTGLGALTPLGNSVSEYWDGLLNGVSGACQITKFDASKFKTHFACEVKNFDPLVYLEKKEARKLDPFSTYLFAFWLSWSKLYYSFCMCIINQCSH